MKESNLEQPKPKSELGYELLSSGAVSANEVIRRANAGALLENDGAKLAAALETLRSAMNRLEGTDDFEEAHRALDTVGRAQNQIFPSSCLFSYEDGNYIDKCPVSLAHTRVGVSIGVIIRESECSVCGRDPEDCAHVSGRTYGGIFCSRIVKRFDADHVALVETPDFPDARVTASVVDMARFQAAFGDDFVPGTQVTCDRCLTDCAGVHRPLRR